MLRRGILLILAALAAVACGASSDASTTVGSAEPTDPVTAPVPVVETTTTLSEMTTTSALAESVDPEDVSDEVIEFVAALAELLAETEYVDSIITDPEVFVATGILFCEQLTAGTAPPDVLTDYVETLTGGDIEEADDDPLTLAGSILGTAVGYLCPEHTRMLEESL